MDLQLYALLNKKIKQALETNANTYYGVKFTGSNPVGERTGDAVGLAANVGVDATGGLNHFDNVYPWSQMRRCNLSDNGAVLAYEGEPGFKLDGSNGNVMVEIPKFYQYRNQGGDGEIREYRISRYKLDGYWLNPRFIKADGTELDKIYIGAYEASTDNTKLFSRSGMYPAVNMNRQVSRNRAKANGQGWGIGDYLERNIIETLFYVEFATLNSQSIMQGQVNFAAKKSVLAENGVNRVVFVNADIPQYVVGQTVWIANSNRKILSIETVDASTKAIVVDGEQFNTTVEMEVDARGWMTGSADGVKASSGSLLSNTDGKHPFHYRGIENPWGNIWEWVDGICIKDFKCHIATNPTDYADDKFDGPYQPVSFLNSDVSGYAKIMGYDKLNPFVALPIDTVGGSTSTYYSDYYYQNGLGNRAPLVGGGWDSGGYAGVACWHCSSGWTGSSSNIGARLSYKAL